jgi:hypothetical protein
LEARRNLKRIREIGDPHGIRAARISAELAGYTKDTRNNDRVSTIEVVRNKLNAHAVSRPSP